MARGGIRTNPGGRPRKDNPRVQRGMRWDPEVQAAIEAWAEPRGLDFTAAVHALCKIGMGHQS